MTVPWASIAKIEADGEHSGTGFLVTPQHVLTARHVVADSTGRPFPRIKLRFYRDKAPGRRELFLETGASLLPDLSSEPDDFALLLCDEPPPSKPLRLSDVCSPFHDCSAPGFAIEKPDGFTVIGRIASPNDPMGPNGTAISIQFNFGDGVLMKGHSGAPLFVNNRVVGLLRTAFLDDKEKTTGSIVFASPVARVIELCGQKCPGMIGYSSPVTWPAPTSNPHSIADRKEEFEIFERMITGQSKERILLLRGESGSGKTVLAEELIAYAKGLGIAVAQVDCKGSPSLDPVVTSFLLGIEDFTPTAASTTGFPRYTALIDDLAILEQPLLLALDTWQQCSVDVRKWLERSSFLPNLARMPAVVVMIGGHEVPDAKGTAWSDLAIPVRHLGVIRSIDDWFEYARQKWPDVPFERAHVQALVFATGGQPNTMDVMLETVRRNLTAGDASGVAS